MPLAAGLMDRRITIQSFTETQDAAGQTIKTWSDLATVWAQVVPLALTARGGANEQFGDQQIVATAEMRFVVRYRTDLSVEMRIDYEGELFDILSISEIGRHEGLQLIARKVQA